MSRLRLVLPPTVEHEPVTFPFPGVDDASGKEGWRDHIKHVEGLLDRIQEKVDELSTDLDAETLPFADHDGDDWPPFAA
jgi:hypothetical protein